MSNLVNVFNFDGYQIRTIVQDGEPWFVAGEVASALGYQNIHKAIIDHCNRAELLKPNVALGLTSSPRGITIIPEGDVYRLTMKSRLASAVKFQDWVTDEVLPTIRKTGQYVAAELTELEAAKQYLAIAQKYVEVVEEKEKLTIELREAQPKLVGFTKLIDSEDLFTVDQVAKNNGVGPNKLRDYMRMLGFLRADKANWNQPSAPIMKKQLMEVKFVPVNIGDKVFHKATAYFTGSGIDWIRTVLEKQKEKDYAFFKRALVS